MQPRSETLQEALVKACENALNMLTDPCLGEDDGERQEPEIQELTAVLARDEGVKRREDRPNTASGCPYPMTPEEYAATGAGPVRIADSLRLR